MHARARRQELDEWQARLEGRAFEPDNHVRENALNEVGYTPYSTTAQMARARHGLPDGYAPNFIGYAHGRDGRDGRRPRRRIKGYTADQYARQMDWRDTVEREEMARFRASRPAKPRPQPMTDEERGILGRAAVERARDRPRNTDNQVIPDVTRVRTADQARLPAELRGEQASATPFALAFRNGRVVGHSRKRS